MTSRAPHRRIAGLIDLDDLAQAAECFRTLAHPHRLRMVEMLLGDRYTVGELAEACAIPSAMASGHLRLLQRCGLLSQEKEGRNVYYRVAEPCLGDILACIRKRFAGQAKGLNVMLPKYH
jgi:ArsR family transcriptional regulator, zinc-responsive transcriptional repressor